MQSSREPSSEATQSLRDEEQQLEQYACTLRGYFLEHCLDDRKQNHLVTIAGTYVLHEPYASALQGLKENKEPAQPINDIASFLSEPAEPIDPSSTTSLALVVGLAINPFAEIEVLYKNLADSKQKRKPIGIAEPSSQQLVELDRWFGADGSNNILLVVIPVQPEKKKRSFGALVLHGDDEYPTAHNIPGDEIFFFAEFRDGATCYAAREMGWKELVGERLQLALGQRGGEELPNQGVVGEHRRKKPVRMPAAPKASVEIDGLVVRFDTTNDIVHLQEAKAKLDAKLEEAERNACGPGSAIFKFTHIQEEFDEEDSEAMVGEVGKLWPTLQGVTASRLSQLRDSLKASDDQEIVDFPHLRAFLTRGICYLESSGTRALLDAKRATTE